MHKFPDFSRPYRGCFGLLGAALILTLWISAIGAHDEGSAEARRLYSAGTILPLDYFIVQALDRHPGRAIDARLHYEKGCDRYVYEILVLDPRGEILTLEFDARSGRLLEREKGAD